MLPKALAFRDDEGKPVVLGEVFDGKHPVIFTLNYSNCPMLCSLQLTGLVKGLKQVEWGIEPGLPHRHREPGRRTSPDRGRNARRTAT